jgi:hypothetical protein
MNVYCRRNLRAQMHDGCQELKSTAETGAILLPDQPFVPSAFLHAAVARVARHAHGAAHGCLSLPQMYAQSCTDAFVCMHTCVLHEFVRV